MSKYWSEFVIELEPYVPGEQPKQPGLIKLNTNENPYPPTPHAQKILSGNSIDHLRLYPDPESSALKAAIARHCNVNSDNVFVGNGSDEVLALAFMAFFKKDKPLLFPQISYSFYPVYCQLYQIESKTIALTDQFDINFEDYHQENGGIIFPNPNAPTGIAQPLEAIEALLQANTNSVVLVDEAYVDFGASSATALINRYPNVLVVQTLSKSRSLAGIRVGYAVGDAGLIEGLNRVKNSFNSYPIDSLAEKVAIAAIEDVDYFTECTQRIVSTREHTAAQLRARGFTVLPSKANFLFTKPTGIDAATLFTRLREHGILVRYFSKASVSEYLRITIGTDEDMNALINAIDQILG